ncbi:MAG TPA: hypothetical protein VF604_09125 [Pyrinomonadaceae bacterium]|jgi:hypothetical protein
MEKLVSFAKNLLTNRFGIVLAALNLCYFVSGNFIGGHFSLSNFDKIMLSQNAPAIVLSFAPNRLIHFLFPELDWLSLSQITLIFILSFVALQWLFIGWTSKMIARKLIKLKT